MAFSLASRLAWCPQLNREIGLSPIASFRCNLTRSLRLRNARATEEGTSATEEVNPPASESKDTSLDISKEVSVPEGGKLPNEATKKKQRKEDAGGTAQVSAITAVVLGVVYLALVALLESRGSKLQPPPPEAFLP